MTATSGLDSTIAEDMVGAAVGQQSSPSFTTSGSPGLRLQSSGTAPSETGDTTYVSGGSIGANGLVAFNTPSTVWGAPSYSAGVVSVTNSGSTGAVTQTGMPAVASPGVNYASIWDGAPKRWWWGALTAAVITNSGDTLTFAQSSITASINM